MNVSNYQKAMPMGRPLALHLDMVDYGCIKLKGFSSTYSALDVINHNPTDYAIYTTTVKQ